MTADRPRSAVGATIAVAGAVAARPSLWVEAIRAAGSLVPDRWWTRRPPLPVPDRRWIRFRLVTAYGGVGRLGALERDDVVTWLQWRRQLRTAPR